MKKRLMHFQKALKTRENKKILYANDLSRCATMFFDLIQEELVMNNEVLFSGIGKFVAKTRKSGEIYDNINKQKVITNPKKNVHFICSNTMKGKINAGVK